MNETCPACGTVYRIDPRKVPDAGVKAQCANCPEIFEVKVRAEETAAVNIPVMEPSPTSATERDDSDWEGSTKSDSEIETDSPLPPPPFGSTDPHQRAKRLARALVSDIVVYHPDRRARSLRQGTVRQEFREEIRKSWDEYAGQVGNEFARQTSYFREALNEILAEGAELF